MLTPITSRSALVFSQVVGPRRVACSMTGLSLFPQLSQQYALGVIFHMSFSIHFMLRPCVQQNNSAVGVTDWIEPNGFTSKLIKLFATAVSGQVPSTAELAFTLSRSTPESSMLKETNYSNRTSFAKNRRLSSKQSNPTKLIELLTARRR